MSALRLARLLHLASPLLPVGAYSYSQGLESAIAQGWVRDETSSREWIANILTHIVGRVEAPVFLRLWRAAQADDTPTFCRWNTWFIASRETRELRAETVQMGHALVRLAPTLAPSLRELFSQCDAVAYPVAFAAYCSAWAIEQGEALVAYLWAYAENQVSAAVKILPLGQTAGQRILVALQECCTDVARRAAAIEDEAIGSAGLGFALASCLHETQYMRLFRS